MLPTCEEIRIEGEGRRLHFLAQNVKRTAVNLLQRVAIHKFGSSFGLRCEAPMHELARLDKGIQLHLQPVFREGIALTDAFQRNRSRICQKTLKNRVARRLRACDFRQHERCTIILRHFR
ncbi:MAG: hypothetical protein BWY63_00642 [Chloroflexi bacterium ADurb.Bin360]|nr:MAG: hypothetical protein BWY63_00642 [Chloroflexi bacterium ADurb.Bin360]